ncbi:MAG: NHL repeat-containing protein [Leptospirales bacterium]
MSCANSDDLYQALQQRIDELTSRVYSTTASRVYGQSGSYTTNNVNNGAAPDPASGDSLYSPYDVAVDSSDGIYVADNSNCRVLYYASGSTSASRVYGQDGSLWANICNSGGITPDSLNSPTGVALDSSGNLYVADAFNNRVLYYNSSSVSASDVYGQFGDFTSGTANNLGLSEESLNVPYGVAIDSGGGLLVSDFNNYRVLYYNSSSVIASQVYGQFGDFTTNTSNNGGVSPESLSTPYGVAFDSDDGIYVADGGNNRVLYYASGGPTSGTASRVYGQAGDFTTSTANNGGISADTLSTPIGVVVDSFGGLYVADAGNNRVLYYPSGSTTATRVYGQFGDFTTNTANNGGVSGDSLYYPSGVEVDSNDGLYVADSTNNRVLYFY